MNRIETGVVSEGMRKYRRTARALPTPAAAPLGLSEGATTMKRRTRARRDGLRKLVVGSSAALVLAMFAGVSQAAEETQFYSNISLGYPTYPTYYAEGDTEFADDVPFSGSHLISSFTFGYRSPEPVHATFRFYGVDSATGLLGERVAQIERDLPAVSDATPTVTLSEAEQFWWTAGANLYPGEFKGSVPTGGWYSIQFSSAGGGYPDARFRLAMGTSSTGMLNVKTGSLITLMDTNGSSPTSMYLKVRDVGSSGEVQPTLISLTALPATVKAGNSLGNTAQLFPVLSSDALAGGTTVTLRSSNPQVASVPSQIVIPAGASNLTVNVTTARRVSTTRTVTFTATANGTSVSTQLAVTP
ncbi:hypothetical protein [Frankia sp. AgB32]|uniref:hypothetical protein n=1 Tax=Frankia sp. AgB32 TaxID=631119 RepID=UPI00200C86BA|nr:hypothetical protein [Frankia sp. AgB32]MCK9897212.1 hypothetical protein [Frankia sp. AgB32]